MLEKLTLRHYMDFMKAVADVEDTDEQNFILYQTMIDPTATKETVPTKKVLEETVKLWKEMEDNKELVRIIEIGDAEFGFIPDLEQITFGEVMDLDMYMTDVSLHNRLMAVLYRPILEKHKEQYNIISYKGTDGFADIMMDTPLKAYFSAIAFFERLGTALQRAIPSYSRHQARVASKKA